MVIVAISEMEIFTPDEPNGLLATVFGEQSPDPKPRPRGFRMTILVVWRKGNL